MDRGLNICKRKLIENIMRVEREVHPAYTRVDTKDISEFLRLMPVQIYINIAMAVSKSSL